MQIRNVCKSRINPMDIGWFLKVKKKVLVNIKVIKINWKISRNSLYKILILEINEKEISFFLKF